MSAVLQPARQGFTQKGAAAQLSSVLAENDLLIEQLTAYEAFSEPFVVQLAMKSGRVDISPHQMVGSSATVRLTRPSGLARFFNGVFRSFSHVGVDASFAYYRAELVPSLWLMGLDQERRIFQSMSALQIIEAHLSRYPVVVDKRLTETCPVRDYCVQYDETPLAFITRLMEEEGIWYFFEHAANSHRLVLADGLSAHKPSGAKGPLVFRGRQAQVEYDDSLLRLEQTEQLVTKTWASGDYNMTTPLTALDSQASGELGKGRWFTYPGPHDTAGRAADINRRAMQAAQARATEISGDSVNCGLWPGSTVSVTEHPQTGLNKDYTLCRVVHELSAEGYRNQFHALPTSQAYRPARTSPRPRVTGSHSAVVVGPEGETIWTDSLGRIRVRFFWDQYAPADETSSCWVRVSQSWAGNGWGALFIPRVGHEVLVSYIDGDPDRPVVTGSVYNAAMAPPVDLPGSKTQSVIGSKSVKQSSSLFDALKKAAVVALTDSVKAGARSLIDSLVAGKEGRCHGNQIRFEDAKGDEELYFHAQKDMTIDIEDSLSTTLYEGSEEHLLKKGDRTVTVEKGKETHFVKAERSVSVEGAETHQNKDDFSHTVTKNYTLKIDGDLTIEVGGAFQLKSTGALSAETADAMSLKAANAVSAKSGTDFEIQAGTAVSAKSGTDFEIQAGTALTAKAATQGQIDGGATLAIKGGMVNIN